MSGVLEFVGKPVTLTQLKKKPLVQSVPFKSQFELKSTRNIHRGLGYLILTTLALSYEHFALEPVGNFAVPRRHFLDGAGSDFGLCLWF